LIEEDIGVNCYEVSLSYSYPDPAIQVMIFREKPPPTRTSLQSLLDVCRLRTNRRLYTWHIGHHIRTQWL